MVMAWVAAGVTGLGLGAAIVGGEPAPGFFVLASLVAALVAWGFMIALQWRLCSVMERNNEGYTALFAGLPQPIWLADNATLAIVAVNQAASEKYGYSNVEFVGLSVLDLYRSEDRDEIRTFWAEGAETTGQTRHVETHVAKGGTTISAEVLSTTIDLDDRSVRMMVVTDVTERDDALAGTRQSGARYRQIVETAKEGILTLDTTSAISAVNQRAADILGYSMDELIGHHLSEFSVAGEADPARTGTAPETVGTLAAERETTLRRKDGAIVSVLLNESPLLDGDGKYVGQLGMITDLTERKWFEDELAFLAVHDPLTRLPNRLLLVDRLQLALKRAEQAGLDVAVVFVDVDGLNEVNTAHGERAGDQLLVEMASRLSRAVREHDTVARLGGDEFVVVSEGTDLFAEQLAARLRAAVATSYCIGGSQLEITASLGVAVGRCGELPGALLSEADLALLQAKANGRNRTEFFTEALRTSSSQRLTTAADLRRAIERQEFSLRFQPVVSLADESIFGAEALIRWEHPQRGTLSPQEFISVAEETGLIDPIGQWVIEETCRQLAVWQRLMPKLSMSLNISARQLRAGVLDIVRNAIAVTGVNPSLLTLEITEGILMDDVDRSIGALTALRQIGVAISIDDFGTGYSSLSYLKRFPIDILKIDQSFVAGLPEDAYDTALIEAVLAIAGALNLSVIAEGVETGDQARTLVDLGCDKAQGYHFYRPLTADDFEAQLKL